MKQQLQEELKGSTFWMDLTARDGIFYADPDKVQDVQQLLEQRHGIMPTTPIEVKHSLFNNVLPLLEPQLQGFKMENSPYPPFVHIMMLNTMILTAREDSPSLAQNHFECLHFHA